MPSSCPLPPHQVPQLSRIILSFNTQINWSSSFEMSLKISEGAGGERATLWVSVPVPPFPLTCPTHAPRPSGCPLFSSVCSAHKGQHRFSSSLPKNSTCKSLTFNSLLLNFELMQWIIGKSKKIEHWISLSYKSINSSQPWETFHRFHLP